jgi:phosphoribosyl-AMP cyclohydrolase
VVQDADTMQVLMVAWMSKESLRLTQETGETHFWSRSRQTLWHKGATSGNVQTVRDIRVDCDGDTLLLLVDPAGPACHTGMTSCFFQEL